MALSTLERRKAALAVWLRRARPNQLLPVRAFFVWLLMAGRGFGKTRTGAEAVALLMVNRPGIRVALVGQTFGDGRDTMVEGESGLLAVLERYYGADVHRWWNRTMGEIVLPNKSRAKVYSAERPRSLRGPQHHVAWCDELAWWAYPRAAWDALVFGLRLGPSPFVIVTTTPRPVALIRELVDAADTVVTTGSTLDNAANLPAITMRKLLEAYDGTRTGQQELHGQLLMDAEGARWNQELLTPARVQVDVPELDAVVVAMDPAVTSTEDSDSTGLAVVGRGPAPAGWAPAPATVARVRQSRPGLSYAEAMAEVRAWPHLYVLHSEAGQWTPTEACERAVDLADLWDADHVTLEVDNGGDYVPTVLRQVDPDAVWRVVRCHGDKLERAEPAALLYEQGRAHHVGVHQVLEDQQVSYTGGKKEPSPDLLDALAHGVADLFPQAPARRGSGRKRKAARLVTA